MRYMLKRCSKGAPSWGSFLAASVRASHVLSPGALRPLLRLRLGVRLGGFLRPRPRGGRPWGGPLRPASLAAPREHVTKTRVSPCVSLCRPLPLRGAVMPVVVRLLFSGEHGLPWLILGARSPSSCGGESSRGAFGGGKSEAGGMGTYPSLSKGVGGGGGHNHRKPTICIFIQHHKMWTGIVCPAVPREGLRPL